MVKLSWCLTSVSNPNRHLHGPFDTRAQAEREAIKLLSPEIKESMKAQVLAKGYARTPVRLVPTPCDGSLHVRPERYTVSQHLAEPTPRIRTLARAPVPSAIYKLTEGKLRYFAAQLGITLPPTAVTRADIISIITKEIDL